VALAGQPAGVAEESAMHLESVRRLKTELKAEVRRRLATRRTLPRVARVVPTALPGAVPKAPIALGITRRGKREFLLAVRVRRLTPGLQSILRYLDRRARGEIDVRLVGTVVKQVPWHRKRNRPLRIGGSLGHGAVTAGTLGCFVAPRTGGDGVDRILSNNHVLARENAARRGDPILQPGRADGGRRARDVVARLDRFVALKRAGPNTVDAAAAALEGGISYYYAAVEGRGDVRGVREAPVAIGDRVYKVGRTTGLTEGRITAIEVDGLLVAYDTGDLVFDNQIEIEPAAWGAPFSLGGDSGSLIVDGTRKAAALLFAGNDVDTTYANPIGEVLEALDVDLVW
jgi:hypothetical protein